MRKNESILKIQIWYECALLVKVSKKTSKILGVGL